MPKALDGHCLGVTFTKYMDLYMVLNAVFGLVIVLKTAGILWSCRPHPLPGNSWTSVGCRLLVPMLLCGIIFLFRSSLGNRTLLSDTPLLMALESNTMPILPGYLGCYTLEVGKYHCSSSSLRGGCQAGVTFMSSTAGELPDWCCLIRPCSIIYGWDVLDG